MEASWKSILMVVGLIGVLLLTSVSIGTLTQTSRAVPLAPKLVCRLLGLSVLKRAYEEQRAARTMRRIDSYEVLSSFAPTLVVLVVQHDTEP